MSNTHELGHFSKFDKWHLNLIWSVPGTLERTIIQFWPKVATQEAPGLPMDDNLPTRKIGLKKFYDQEMVKKGLVEISAAPNRPFWGGGVQNFFFPHQRGSKSPAKMFWCRLNHFEAMKASQSRKLLKLGPKTRFCRNFCTPKFDLFGAGWPKNFRPAPKGSQSPQKTFWVTPNSFLDSVRLSESKIADFRPKTEISESQFGRNFCMWVSGPPQKIFLS